MVWAVSCCSTGWAVAIQAVEGAQVQMQWRWSEAQPVEDWFQAGGGTWVVGAQWQDW